MRSKAVIMAALLLGACGIGNAQDHKASGPQSTRSYDVRGFERVALRGSDDVIVKVGSAESVSVSGPADVLNELEVEVKNGELRLGRKRGNWGVNMRDARGHAVFTVTLPRLTGAAVAGSGDMSVDRAQAPAFSGAVAGSGNLRIAALQAETASFDIAGSGDTQIGGGGARALTVSIAGSGDLDGAGFKAENAKISVAGSGNVRAGVAKDADVSIIGTGDVEIIGSAKCRVNKMGPGNVRCAG